MDSKCKTCSVCRLIRIIYSFYTLFHFISCAWVHNPPNSLYTSHAVRTYPSLLISSSNKGVSVLSGSHLLVGQTPIFLLWFWLLSSKGLTKALSWITSENLLSTASFRPTLVALLRSSMWSCLRWTTFYVSQLYLNCILRKPYLQLYWLFIIHLCWVLSAVAQ